MDFYACEPKHKQDCRTRTSHAKQLIVHSKKYCKHWRLVQSMEIPTQREKNAVVFCAGSQHTPQRNRKSGRGVFLVSLSRHWKQVGMHSLPDEIIHRMWRRLPCLSFHSDFAIICRWLRSRCTIGIYFSRGWHAMRYKKYTLCFRFIRLLDFSGALTLF